MTSGPTWLTRAPSREVAVGALLLRPYGPGDADELSRAIGDNIEHLSPWMEWIADEPLGTEGRSRFIAACAEDWDDKRNFMYGIFDSDRLIGGTGLHLRGEAGSMEIGYWVDLGHTRRGIATAVTQALVEQALAIAEVEVVRIAHEPNNTASARIPEKLGFTRVASGGDARCNVVWELRRHGARAGRD